MVEKNPRGMGETNYNNCTHMSSKLFDNLYIYSLLLSKYGRLL